MLLDSPLYPYKYVLAKTGVFTCYGMMLFYILFLYRNELINYLCQDKNYICNITL